MADRLWSIPKAINFQTYLNTAQTEFSWEGTVTVGSETQKIKVHTHSLTNNAALFCIHRDGRDNTKAVSINLDGQNLVNYTAAGTVTSGSSAWSGSAQTQ